MATAAITSTSSWTPPPTITGFSGTVNEDDSNITLDWTGSTLTTSQFSMYKIYRREFGTSTWLTLVTIYDLTVDSYVDKTAAQTVKYQYKITQFQKVVGDTDLESLSSDIVTTALTSDSWFLIPQTVLDPIELSVTDESHTSVMQQEVFEPLASNRKRVVRGVTLGNEGSVTSLFDVSVARVSKQYFDTFNDVPGPHILKSPFGDVWYVECDAPSFKYNTGGHLEVTFGWIEVA